MQKRLIIRPELCTNCQACMVFCSMVKEHVINPKKARIKILRSWPLVDVPIICRQCSNAQCIKSCPEGAIFIDKITGAVSVKLKECTNCGECIKACPFEAIFIHPDTGDIMICDLCGGDPVCVKHCQTGAIKFTDLRLLVKSKNEKYVREVENITRTLRGGQRNA